MLSRRNKKRQGSAGSVDMLASSTAALPNGNTGAAPGRAFNYLVERARGAIGFGGRERVRTSSNDSLGSGLGDQLSSSPSSRSLYGSSEGQPSLSTSASMQDMSGKGAFFRRGTTTSNPLRPGWFNPAGDSKNSVTSPLKSSPSSPVLSSQAVGGSAEPRRKGSAGALESSHKLAAMTSGASQSAEGLEYTSRKAFSRSTDDLSNRRASRMYSDGLPPMPPMSRRSTDELSRGLARSRTPTVDSSSSRRTRTTSLAPSAALDSYPSPSVSISATSSHTSRSSSPARQTKPSSPVIFPSSGPKLLSISPTPSSKSHDADRKRDSQTVYCQGLLQRKGDYVAPTRPPGSPSGANTLAAPSASASASGSQSYFSPRLPSAALRSPKSDHDLRKGWKPYHAALKGSKLYLHKVPGDLSYSAKALFPSTVLSEEEASRSPLLPFVPISPVVGDDSGKRKQRAFWGTGDSPHPGLIVTTDDQARSTVEGGTLEALVHEMIFNTTSAAVSASVPRVVVEGERSGPADDVAESSEPTEPPALADLILLVWPALPVTAAQLAREFERCASLAVRTLATARSGGDGTVNPKTLQRLQSIIRCIVEQYPQDLRLHPDLRIALSNVLDEMQAALEGEKEGETAVAELKAELERTISVTSEQKSRPLTEWPAVMATSSERVSSSSASTSPSKSRKRLPVSQDHLPTLTVPAFLALDPAEFATQIHYFHHDRLAAITGNISAPRHILRTASLILANDPARRQTALTSLFSFSAAAPHFISRFVLSTVLSSQADSPAKRADILRRWILVGDELERRGDAAGWMAIASAVCCRAIARLEDTWRTVPTDAVSAIRDRWVPRLLDLGFSDGESIAPVKAFAFDDSSASLPYLGSVLEDTVGNLKAATTEKKSISLTPLYAAQAQLDTVAAVWKQAPLADLDVQPDGKLQYLLQVSSRISHTTKRYLAAYLATSLEIEAGTMSQPVLLRTRSPADPNPLVPLVMVEVLPHISLVDREKILHGGHGSLPRKSSNAGLATVVAPPSQLTRRKSYPPHIASNTERSGPLSRLRNEIASPADTLLRFANGDLVLKVLSSAVLPPASSSSTSRRGASLSRTSSWIESRASRVTRNSARASLSSSLAPVSRRSSSSHRDSLPASVGSAEAFAATKLQTALEDEPVQAVVQAGTLEALVDLLVMGADNLLTPTTDADGESTLKGGRPVQIDGGVFCEEFFATFRSFASPLVLFDMLRKRYVAATRASLQLEDTLASIRPFPSWSTAPLSDEDIPDWDCATTIRLGILSKVRHWIDRHIRDFLNDAQLWEEATTFFRYVEDDALSSGAPLRYHEVLRAECLRQSDKLRRDALRPPVRSLQSPRSKTLPTLDFDELSTPDLVDLIDRVACDLMHNVTEHDILRYAGLLEGFAVADPSAWYSSRIKVEDDEAVILDSYSHTSALKQDSALWNEMPNSLRITLQAHHIIRRWLIANITMPNISARQRQQRMLKMIEAIGVARSRMSNVIYGGQTEPLSIMTDPSLASFVERVLASAIVAPESRYFSASWQAVAAGRQKSTDTLVGLLRTDMPLTDATATLDIAWLNERLLEIATQVDSLYDEFLINFSKRRWMFNTVRNASDIRPSQSNAGSSDILAQMEKQVTQGSSWSPRDVASLENTKASKSVKPFGRLVALQQEKTRRDRALKDVVSRGIKLEQQSRLQREREVAKAMDKSTGVRTKRMTSLFNFGRPVSASAASASTTSATPAPTAHSLIALREWSPHSKPHLVLTLSGVEVQPYDNTHRSFVFELSTEDGQRSLFQTPSRDEFDLWLNQLRRSGTQIAFRRATFLAQTAVAEEEPEEPAKTTPVSKSASTSVFCVPLSELVEREATNLPAFVEAAIALIEAKGLGEVGIYRISGENKVISTLKQGIDGGLDPSTVLANVDVHNATGLLKLFLRELPEPVIPHDMYDAFISSHVIPGYDERLYAIRELVWKLPQPNFRLLRRFMEHLDKITDHEEVNAMHAANLSIIFAPTLLKPPPGPDAFIKSVSNLGQAAGIVKSLILQEGWLFGEAAEEESEAVVAVEDTTEASSPSLGIGLGLDTGTPTLGSVRQSVELDSPVVGRDDEVLQLPAPAFDISDTSIEPVDFNDDDMIADEQLDTISPAELPNLVMPPRTAKQLRRQSLALSVPTSTYIDSLTLPSPISPSM